MFLLFLPFLYIRELSSIISAQLLKKRGDHRSRNIINNTKATDAGIKLIVNECSRIVNHFFVVLAGDVKTAACSVYPNKK